MIKVNRVYRDGLWNINLRGNLCSKVYIFEGEKGKIGF